MIPQKLHHTVCSTSAQLPVSSVACDTSTLTVMLTVTCMFEKVISQQYACIVDRLLRYHFFKHAHVTVLQASELDLQYNQTWINQLSNVHQF